MNPKENVFYRSVRGFPGPVSKLFTEENMENAMDFVPDDGDIIIASYPKTGSTWMQYTVLQIISKGESFPSFNDLVFKIGPSIVVAGVAAVQAQNRPRFYKHHFPYNIVKKNVNAKTIYIYRHPEDTVLSYYHFAQSLNPDRVYKFDEHFEHFVSGEIAYGSYFRHVLSFYEHRHDSNLLMVSYEKLHANRKEEILRIAKFLGGEHYKKLEEDEDILDKIMLHTSFDYMKKNLHLINPSDNSEVSFFRKGIVGDGKIVLSDIQRQLLKESAEKFLQGTSILKEWYRI